MDNKKISCVLVVDDAEEITAIVEILLEEAGHRAHCVGDGQQALDCIEAVNPDLVLLDIDMPVMDGFSTCEQLKKNPGTRDIPVIFLTSHSDVEAIARGFELGAVDYLTKPFGDAELLARVNTHLDLRHAMRRLDRLAGDLAKYLSPAVYNSIFEGKTGARIAADLRPITTCFLDIVAFTPQVESRTPTETAQWINDYFNEMATIVENFGGTLDKYIGDAIMVFFGAPESRGAEEDARRCVQMANAMQRRAREMDIQTRAGVSSGECTVGNFGSESHISYTIFGKEVNVAARLQAESAPGRTLISDSTYRLLEGTIPCEKHGEMRVKGIDRDIVTYWAGG